MHQQVLVTIGIVVLVALAVAGVVLAVARRGRPAARLAPAPGHRPGHTRPAGVSTAAGLPAAPPPVRGPAPEPEPTAVFADQLQVRVIVMDPHDPDWRPGFVQGVRIDGPRVTAVGHHIDDGSPWTMSVPANRPFVVQVPAAQLFPRPAELAPVRAAPRPA